ncbi:MAG: ribose-phosphate pyrophosphokinase [Phycisphaerae bacterium]
MITGYDMESNRNLDRIRVFAGSSVPALAEQTCARLGVPLGDAVIDSFPDGETTIKLEDDVRGRDCFVIQSTSPPVNDNLMELLIFIDSLRRASADRITAVIPYFGYARQDRKAEGRTPITAKLVANMITTAGVDRVLAMDLHADQIQGFFDIPVDHLTAAPMICGHFKSLNLNDIVLVSPDVGNIKTANKFASQLGGELAVIDKRRTGGDRATAVNIIGDVAGKTVCIFDDMITTAGTATEAARLVREHGAVEVCLAATHAVFAGPAFERLSGAGLKHLVITDTIALSAEDSARLPNLTTLTVSNLLAEAIRRIHHHESISALFKEPSDSCSAIDARVGG